jgi:hypothetical protein
MFSQKKNIIKVIKVPKCKFKLSQVSDGKIFTTNKKFIEKTHKQKNVYKRGNVTFAMIFLLLKAF